jgi:hypothetical protein
MTDDLFDRISKSVLKMDRSELDAAWREIGRVKLLIRTAAGLSRSSVRDRLFKANQTLDVVLDEMYFRDNPYIRRNHPNFSFTRFYLKPVDAVHSRL